MSQAIDSKTSRSYELVNMSFNCINIKEFITTLQYFQYLVPFSKVVVILFYDEMLRRRVHLRHVDSGAIETFSFIWTVYRCVDNKKPSGIMVFPYMGFEVVCCGELGITLFTYFRFGCVDFTMHLCIMFFHCSVRCELHRTEITFYTSFYNFPFDTGSIMFHFRIHKGLCISNFYSYVLIYDSRVLKLFVITISNSTFSLSSLSSSSTCLKW